MDISLWANQPGINLESGLERSSASSQPEVSNTLLPKASASQAG
jgi:hypothetical protein